MSHPKVVGVLLFCFVVSNVNAVSRRRSFNHIPHFPQHFMYPAFVASPRVFIPGQDQVAAALLRATMYFDEHNIKYPHLSNRRPLGYQHPSKYGSIGSGDHNGKPLEDIKYDSGRSSEYSGTSYQVPNYSQTNFDTNNNAYDSYSVSAYVAPSSAYETTSVSPSAYETSHGTSGYETSHSSYETPSHGSSLLETPSHSSSLLETPSHGSSFLETPSHGSSLLETPSHGSSLLETPSHGSSVLETPSHGSSFLETPSYSGTSYEAQNHDAYATPNSGSYDNGHDIGSLENTKVTQEAGLQDLTDVSHHGNHLENHFTEHNSEEGNEVEDEPSRYKFGYRISDAYTGMEYGQAEAKEGEVTKGHYHVLLPDGRMQHVHYWSDRSGYHAKITYDDQPQPHPSQAHLYR